MAQHEVNLQPADSRRLEDAASPAFGISLAVGIAGLVLALGAALIYQAIDGSGIRRFGFAYLTAFAFVLSIALGGLFFVVVTHLFRAGWSILIRRVAEVIAANMPVLGILFLPILVYVAAWNGALYPWAQSFDGVGHGHDDATHAAAEHAPGNAAILTVANDTDPAIEMSGEHAVVSDQAEDAVHGHPEQDWRIDEASLAYNVEGKRAYLSGWTFTLRWIIYFVLWSAIGIWYWRTSTRQDLTGDAGLTNRMESCSAPALILFGISITFAAFDLLMSLDPTWYSTMFGIYYFAGSFQAILATLILLLLGLQSRGFLPSVNREHYHDLGKLLFAFVVFYAYVAFSQYMLIWYSAIPGEQPWLIARGMSTNVGHETPWSLFALALLFGKFVIPFLGMMSRHAKRNIKVLAFWACWMLVMQYIDVFWLVMPSFNDVRVPVPVIELLCLAGVGGIFAAGAVRIAARHSLVAVGDPRLPESLAFVNT